MGFHALNMTNSQKLGEVVARYEQYEDADDWLCDCADLASTSGYDNDGNIGPEMIDLGVGLGLAATKHGPNAKVFFAFGDDYCYYQIGNSEDEAVARFVEQAEKVAAESSTQTE